MTAAGSSFAEALFMLARENDCLEQFSECLARVDKEFSSNGEYALFLSSPNIPLKERVAAVEAAFGGKVHEHVLSFLQLLCEHGKIAEIHECIKEFEALKKNADNVVTASVKSASELSDEQQRALIDKLQRVTGKTVIIETKIDKSLIGGICVEVDGKVFDGSLKKQLRDVKEVISL